MYSLTMASASSLLMSDWVDDLRNSALAIGTPIRRLFALKAEGRNTGDVGFYWGAGLIANIHFFYYCKTIAALCSNWCIGIIIVGVIRAAPRRLINGNVRISSKLP
jgi:hypothetical protein